MANILEDWMALADAQMVQRGLYTRDNIRILPNDHEDLVETLALGAEHALGTTDALAAVLMRREGLEEIYSFDTDFERFPDLRRVSK